MCEHFQLGEGNSVCCCPAFWVLSQCRWQSTCFDHRIAQKKKYSMSCPMLGMLAALAAGGKRRELCVT
jgi:hypothetical protein